MSTGYAVDRNSTPRSRSVFAITVNKEAKVHLDQGLAISISFWNSEEFTYRSSHGHGVILLFKLHGRSLRSYDV